MFALYIIVFPRNVNSGGRCIKHTKWVECKGLPVSLLGSLGEFVLPHLHARFMNMSGSDMSQLGGWSLTFVSRTGSLLVDTAEYIYFKDYRQSCRNDCIGSSCSREGSSGP